jgi:hypothetical protein
MEDAAQWMGIIGVGLIAAGIVAIRGHLRRRKLAAAGDERAKAELTARRNIDAVVAPFLIVIGVGMLLFELYGYYQKGFR